MATLASGTFLGRHLVDLPGMWVAFPLAHSEVSVQPGPGSPDNPRQDVLLPGFSGFWALGPTSRSGAEVRTRRSAEILGQHFLTWRKLQRLTAAQVAERAGIDRGTLRRLEHGDLGVSLGVALNVARAVGQLDRLVDALDPYETDLGRSRADQALPQRVRR